MRDASGRCQLAFVFAAWAVAAICSARADEPLSARWLAPVEVWVSFEENPIRLVTQVERSTQPFEAPSQPFEAPTQPFEAPATGLDEGPSFRSSPALRALLDQEPTPTANAVSRAEVPTIAPTDLGSVLQNSDNVQTLNSFRRSQIAFDPHVRGYRFGEIYTQWAGEYYLPARLDLDSMLNKIDPYLVQSVTVIPGPYGLRYGPGFAFIDVVPIDTPRSNCGPQWNNRFSILTRANGGQIIGSDTLSGAGQNYGFISNYGYRIGSDYRAGNGQLIPSSYHMQNALLNLGWDTANGRVEARYNRFDMWNTEYALQFFDISSMQTDSYNLNYAGVDPMTDAQNLVQVWYNQTHFRGNNLGQDKDEIRARLADGLNFPGAFTADSFQSFVSGNLVSTGARAVRTYGDATAEYARLGADVRYITQSTTEQFHIRDPGMLLNPDQANFTTNQPHSALTDPGLFAEYNAPWTSFFSTAIGGRVDYVNTHPRASQFDNTPVFPGVGSVPLSQNDVLLATYLTGLLELTPEWSLRGGVGYAERVPDLVNRYADGIHLSVAQNPLTTVIGFPALKKSRATQADISAIGDYGVATGRVSAFYSWINDYNTYSTFTTDPNTGANILLAQNTALATLGGFECYGDYDATDITTFFATAQYVQGIDQVISRPLPQIYPFQSRLGVRWTDPTPANDWGLEWGFRFVAAQNQIGFLRDGIASIRAKQLRTKAVELATAGFWTSYLRAYYNLSQSVHLIGGIDNMFDRTYVEHLDTRLQGTAQTSGGVLGALAPGFTAYAGLEWLL
jgi:iron complex outermembrane recepter protein